MFAFDTLPYARRLRESGIPAQQAEAHADAAREFIMAELVTKTDLHREIEVLRDETAAEFTLVRSEAAAFQNATSVEFAFVRSEIASVRAEIIATKKDLQESIANVRRELTAVIANAELRATIRLGSMLTVAVGILAAIIKL
jgi:hypothetical protein